ncbi:MAG: TIGR02265 family protein [Archangium sp.]|nr:TIGR02265 family protein [Archangium sp.]MDP3572197.1 TIGR02265 family protein [Archangium sp.]
MPTDPQELSSRLALCTPDDRVRGMMINEVLKLVEQKAGAEARAEAAKVLPEGVRHRDLVSYPISDFMRLMYRSADLLEKTYGGHVEALQACGGATVDAFSRTPAGRMLFSVVALAGPTQILKGASVGYRSVVTYGSREYEPKGPRSGLMRMSKDMQPAAYHVGVMLAVLRAVGHSAQVVARPLGLDSAEYEISWDDGATKPQS